MRKRRVWRVVLAVCVESLQMEDPKCDRCGKDAVVHETVITQNQTEELHLCEQCAREEGFEINPASSVLPILKHVIAAHVQLSPSDESDNQERASRECSTCGRTFAQFRKSSLLGCPACYTQFATKLSPILSREHEGSTHHVGKVPERAATPAGADADSMPEGRCGPAQAADSIAGAPAGTSAAEAQAMHDLELQERESRIAILTNQLRGAVRNEQYERAAMLRDQLAALGPASDGEHD